jgi:hypothetical protein
VSAFSCDVIGANGCIGSISMTSSPVAIVCRLVLEKRKNRSWGPAGTMLPWFSYLREFLSLVFQRTSWSTPTSPSPLSHIQNQKQESR